MSDRDLAVTVRARFNDATADPAAATITALRDLGLTGRSRSDDDIAQRLLVALGYPGGSPRQENPTP